MIEMMQDLLRLDSPLEMRRELGNYLGLEQPVSSAVLRRAQQDDRFALHLVMSRGSRDLVQLHLDDPRNERYAGDDDDEPHAEIVEESHDLSNLELVGGMAGAMFRWGRSGFRGLDEATAAARLETCQSCPHLVEAPDRLLYRVKMVKKSDQRVCRKCGCVAAAKVKVATERCPIGLWGPAA
jgi:hypothetical protein